MRKNGLYPRPIASKTSAVHHERDTAAAARARHRPARLTPDRRLDYLDNVISLG